MKTNKVSQREEKVESKSIKSDAEEEKKSEEVEHKQVQRKPTPDDIEISKEFMMHVYWGAP